jgi:23S rRNA maturation mini-RNase III
MPARSWKLPSGKYRVATPNRVHAKATSKINAEAQVRLLNALEHNPEFKKQVRARALRKRQ